MIRTILLSAFLLMFFPTEKQENLPVASPLPVILDTDMDSDVDDVGALAMLHTYARQGKVKILGVIVTSDEAASAGCTDAINTYFGHPEIPIGVSQRDSLKSFSKYTKQITAEFPNRFATNAAAEDGTIVYRRLLASAADASVVIITIGHLTSLSRLLDSAPDNISALKGVELVRKKVLRWSCMGGQFPEGKEANFYRPDPASTVNCFSKWPLSVTFAGWEVGNQIVTGGAEFKSRCDPKSPVFRAYELYNGFKGRASWDQVSILEAVEGVAPKDLEPYFTLQKNGYSSVAPDGSNRWVNSSDSQQAYIKMADSGERVRQRIEHLMLGK